MRRRTWPTCCRSTGGCAGGSWRSARRGRGARDSAALLDVSRFQSDPETAWRRVRGAGRLGRRQLGVLRALAAWRDREARRRDLPRGFVLRDEALLELA